MAIDRGPQWAIQDKNQFPALAGHSGTAGTAETRRLIVTEGAAHSFITGGTVSTDAVEVTAFNGGSVAVGTAAVELTFTGVTQGIMITADHSNGTMVYIGGSTVAQDGSAALTSLWPGESVSMDLNDATAAVYAVGGTTNLKIYKASLT